MNYKILPKGYRWAGTLDFTRNRAQILAVLKLAVILTVIPALIGAVVSLIRPEALDFAARWQLWIAMALMLIAYIPLHELAHGIAMLALSGVKPSFGIRLPYAYAGSTVWFDRRSHVVTALTPLVFWGTILQILIFTLPSEWFWPLWIVQISNLSGSAGDIYCAWVLLRMDGRLLIQDTSTRMRIMRYIES